MWHNGATHKIGFIKEVDGWVLVHRRKMCLSIKKCKIKI